MATMYGSFPLLDYLISFLVPTFEVINEDLHLGDSSLSHFALYIFNYSTLLKHSFNIVLFLDAFVGVVVVAPMEAKVLYFICHRCLSNRVRISEHSFSKLSVCIVLIIFFPGDHQGVYLLWREKYPGVTNARNNNRVTTEVYLFQK